jgi:hypothetical protein
MNNITGLGPLQSPVNSLEQWPLANGRLHLHNATPETAVGSFLARTRRELPERQEGFHAFEVLPIFR